MVEHLQVGNCKFILHGPHYFYFSRKKLLPEHDVCTCRIPALDRDSGLLASVIVSTSPILSLPPSTKVSIILKDVTEENMHLHIHGLDTEAIPAMDQSSPDEKRSWWRWIPISPLLLQLQWYYHKQRCTFVMDQCPEMLIPPISIPVKSWKPVLLHVYVLFEVVFVFVVYLFVMDQCNAQRCSAHINPSIIPTARDRRRSSYIFMR